MEFKIFFSIFKGIFFHSIKCRPLFFKEEKNGLWLKLIYKCSICNVLITIDNSDNFKENKKINYQAVLGVLSTGLGYKALSEIYGLLDIKFMKRDLFKKIENDLHTYIKEYTEKSLNKFLLINYFF